MREKRRSLEQAANWCGVLLRCIESELRDEHGVMREQVQEQAQCMSTIAANLNRISHLEHEPHEQNQEREVFPNYSGG